MLSYCQNIDFKMVLLFHFVRKMSKYIYILSKKIAVPH